MRSGSSSSVYLPRSHVVAALETGRGRAQHHARAGGLRAHDGHIAAVIARRLLLLVALIVLFVDHDQAEIAHRREHAGTRAHHHARLARADAAPLLGALGIGESAVQNRHAIAEAREELARHRRRERDLRHQQQRAAARRQRGFDGAQINLGLARAGDAVQQKRVELLAIRWLLRIAANASCCAGFRVCRVRTGPAATSDQRLAGDLQNAFARQRSGRRAGVAYLRFEILEIVRARMQRQKRDQLALGFGQFALLRLVLPARRAVSPTARAADRARSAAARRR